MSKMKKIALLIETSTTYGRELIRGIIQYANISCPWIFYKDPSGLSEKLPSIDKWGLDGIIMRDTPQNLKLLELHIPTIVSIRYQEKIAGIPNIIGNSDLIGKMAAEYFYNKGFTVFAFCGMNNFPWSKEREETFRNAVCSKGTIYIYDQQIKVLDYEKELAAIAQWLSTLPKPVAVMACNDVRGAHIIEACKLAQIQVPDEVAVLGVNNDDMICELTSPPLSSIALDIHKAGQQAAMCLERMMSGKKITEQNIMVEPKHVMTRRSTDILAINNPEIAAAIKYIQHNSKKYIQVNDVTAAVGTNRRSLERSFKQHLKRSIHEEITRMRIDTISRMLTETNLSIAEIAMSMGFSDINHISRYFKASKKISPFKFRKNHA
ncbi:MAG: XylR family transcriptional regulator [Anaerohalosphaeraceae bacterium]